MEASAGIEPAYAVLQTAAFPLRHDALSRAPELQTPEAQNPGLGRPGVLTKSGAGNEARTRDLNLGKVALYQLSYSRRPFESGAILDRHVGLSRQKIEQLRLRRGRASPFNARTFR